jgi:hypothetical protein
MSASLKVHQRIAVVAGMLVALVEGAAGPGSAAFTDVQRPSVHLSAVAKAESKLTRGATTTASVRQTLEGSRYVVTTSLKSPKKATNVTIQKLDPPEYTFQEPEWVNVRTTAVRGRSRIKTVVVATETNTERYRAVVSYKRAKAFTTKPVAVTIWRWIPLSDYDPYYESGDTTFGTFGINGRVYKGWGPWLYSHVGYWEARFTPGRHCAAFRGLVGLDDDSDDGSSGMVALTADDQQVYESQQLSPGTELPVTIPLAKPYRLGVILTDTTPGGTEGHDDIESYPSIGDPELLCTDV